MEYSSEEKFFNGNISLIRIIGEIRVDFQYAVAGITVEFSQIFDRIFYCPNEHKQQFHITTFLLIIELNMGEEIVSKFNIDPKTLGFKALEGCVIAIYGNFSVGHKMFLCHY